MSSTAFWRLDRCAAGIPFETTVHIQQRFALRIRGRCQAAAASRKSDALATGERFRFADWSPSSGCTYLEQIPRSPSAAPAVLVVAHGQPPGPMIVQAHRPPEAESAVDSGNVAGAWSRHSASTVRLVRARAYLHFFSGVRVCGHRRQQRWSRALLQYRSACCRSLSSRLTTRGGPSGPAPSGTVQRALPLQLAFVLNCNGRKGTRVREASRALPCTDLPGHGIGRSVAIDEIGAWEC